MADHLRDATKKVDFISREAAMELIDNAPIIAGNENETLISAPKLSDKVYCLPAADVRPVVKAHWIYHEDDCRDYYECSHCHDEYVVYESDMEWKYCPTCGAEMEKMITGKDANGRT